MSKVKKYTLSLDEELDFEVIGLTSHQFDYRLVWHINSKLNLHFTKSESPLMVFNEKKELEIEFPFYHFEDEMDRIGYFLIKNKNALDFLIPEAPAIDFFLFLTNNHIVELEDLIKELRQIDAVLGAFAFDNQKFKSFQYLEFN